MTLAVDLLNREGIAGSFGGAWSPSTIYGNGKGGTGYSEQRALHRPAYTCACVALDVSDRQDDHPFDIAAS
jgi:hypothetical protein